MQFFSKWLKLWLLLLFGLLCYTFIVFIAAPPVASWDRKIRSADRIFDLEILIRSADRIQFIWYFSFKMKKHLKIKFSLFDTFSLTLKIKQMTPLDFGNFLCCIRYAWNKWQKNHFILVYLIFFSLYLHARSGCWRQFKLAWGKTCKSSDTLIFFSKKLYFFITFSLRQTNY